MAPRSTDVRGLDEAVATLRSHKDEWARLPIPARLSLLERCHDGYLRAAGDVVAAGCRAKALDGASAQGGEEWMSGPVAVVRQIRLFIESLSECASCTATPPSGAVSCTIRGSTKCT